MRTILILFFGVLLSFSLIYFARPISEFLVNRLSRGPRIEESPIAEVVRHDGPGYVRTRESGRFIPVKAGLPLFAKDELKTEKSGRIHIKMPSGYEIELLSESQLILDLWAPKTKPEYFSLTRGAYRVLVTGKKGDLYILQNSRPFSPEEAPLAKDLGRPILVQSGTSYEPDPTPVINITKTGVTELPERAPETNTDNKVGAKMPDKKPPTAQATLTSAYIETILNNQAPLFRRCQLSSLRDGAVSIGNLTLAFAVLKDGSTSGVRTISTSLKNPDLEKCSIDVVVRTKFRSYEGSEVQLSYPIEFR